MINYLNKLEDKIVDVILFCGFTIITLVILGIWKVFEIIIWLFKLGINLCVK